MAFKLTCHGGAETVTGSLFLVESDNGKILIDCGIEQGKDVCDECAYEPFPFEVPSLDALVITHAHLDHVGRAPRLMKEGFTGTIYMTAPTRDLAEAIHRDSVDILRESALQKGREPLYDLGDVESFLATITTLPYHEEREVAPGLSIFLRDTGHILGSASVRIRDASGAALAITSDIGNSPSPLLPDTEPIHDAPVVLMESVYGNRENPEKKDRVALLRDTLKQAIARGGAILIPAFSIERTQLMLYELSNLFESGELPKVPVFLDSPLAISVTDIYRKWGKEYFKEEAKQEVLREGDIFKFPFLELTRSREESDSIHETPNPKIIIAGAGMSHGGRIGRHEQRYLPDLNSTLLIVGYQAPGSPGRLLQDGVKKVRINKREVKVRAKVESLSGWSAHADRNGLLAFAKSCLPGAKTFLVGIGEPSSARFLAQRIHDFLGAKAIVPTAGETFTITKDGVVR